MKRVSIYRGNRLQKVVEDYRAAVVARKEAEKAEAEQRAELVKGLGDRAQLYVGDWLVRLRPVQAVPGRKITAGMVGEMLAGRAGYSVLEVLPAGEDAAS